MNIIKRNISVPTPVPPPVYEVVLTLTGDEAYKLRALTYNGSSVRARILDALADVYTIRPVSSREEHDEFLDDLRNKLNSVGFDVS